MSETIDIETICRQERQRWLREPAHAAITSLAITMLGSDQNVV